MARDLKLLSNTFTRKLGKGDGRDDWKDKRSMLIKFWPLFEILRMHSDSVIS